MKYQNLFSRLSDPEGCADELSFNKMSHKISVAMTRLAGYRENGGNPFLFALIGTKPHELRTHLNTSMVFKTCASDGKVFYWHPDFLSKLDILQTMICMSHEAWHVALDHIKRGEGRHREVWNIAIDYFANSIIEDDWVKAKDPKRKGWTPWGGILGNPMSLKQLTNFLKEGGLLPTKKLIFSDLAMLQKTPEWIYDQIIDLWKDSSHPKRFGPESQASSLDTLDTHLTSELGKDDLDEELANAAKQAESLEAGSTPGFIREYLDKLSNPTIDLAEMVRNCCFFKQRNDGIRNNWKRPRRRSVAMGHYMPQRYTHKPKWLALLDTSGSMSQQDITRGLSQLKSMGDNTDGFVVPCDAKVHWEQITKIESSDNISDVQVIGRGGTIFTEFFSEFKERLGEEFDVIIVITDGIFPKLPNYLDPGIDTIWAIPSHRQMLPPFGRTVGY